LRKQDRSRLEKGRNQPMHLKSHINEVSRFNPYSQTIRHWISLQSSALHRRQGYSCLLPLFVLSTSQRNRHSTEAAHAFAKQRSGEILFSISAG
jgi:hypothetical protein